MLNNFKNISIYELISDNVCKMYKKYKSCILGTFLIGFITHLKIIISFMGSSDFIGSGLYTDVDMTSSGRWLLHYVSRISGIANVHMLLGMISLIFIGLTACMIIDMFHIEHKINRFLVGAIMVVFPTVTSTFLYMYTADAYMISLFLATSSVWVTLKGKKYIPLAIFLLTCSLGIYQAYIAVAMTIIVVLAIIELIKSDNLRGYIYKYMYFLLVGISSVILYYLILKLRLTTLGVNLTSYRNISSVSLENIPEYIKATYVDFFGGGGYSKQERLLPLI